MREDLSDLYQSFEDYCDKKINPSNQAQNEDEINKPKIYLCFQPPHDIPTFNILNNKNSYSLVVSCSCNRNEIMTFENAFITLVHDYDGIFNYDDYFKCSRRNHESKNFKYYCPKCKQNLCELCLKKFKTCPHGELNLFNFLQNHNQYLQKGEEILSRLKKCKKNIDPYILKLFGVIYDNFMKFRTNYSYFDIINIYYAFIETII